MMQIISSILFVFYMVHLQELVNTAGTKIFLPPNTASGGLRHNYGALCTKEGIKGKCVPMRDCKELLELVAARGGIRSRGTPQLLQKRICGYNGPEAYLCCQNINKPVLPSILPTGECGIPTADRIHGGVNIPHGAYPWLVGVGYKDTAKTVKVSCGGTLITKRHVLTAAHCFIINPSTRRDRTIRQSTHVILGEHSLSQDIERLPPLILRIEDRKNPGYLISSPFYKDIEILILERDVEFTRYIKPACLPLDNFIKDFSLKGSKMEIVGWGLTWLGDLKGSDVPLHASVPFVPMSECKSFYKDSGVMIDESQVCLGGNGTDACKGDSGGPALYEETMNKTYVLIGITSFGDGFCRSTTFPGVYTYVPAYMKWILSNL